MGSLAILCDSQTASAAPLVNGAINTILRQSQMPLTTWLGRMAYLASNSLAPCCKTLACKPPVTSYLDLWSLCPLQTGH